MVMAKGGHTEWSWPRGVAQNGHGQGVRVSHLPSRIGLLEAFVLRDGEHGAKLSHVETQSNQ